MRTIEDTRFEWKQYIKAKLKKSGHEITPWLDKHIDYLALLDHDQFQAEINKFNKENPDAATTGTKSESN
jgi:hypothetical protein